MKAILVKEPGGPEKMELAEVPTPAPGPRQALVRDRTPRASISSTSTSASGCTRPSCRSRWGAKARARWKRSGRRSPRSRPETAWPTPWRAAPTPSTRWCPAAQLVKIPDGAGFRTGRGGHAAGHDGALPDALHLSAEERRHVPGARGRGRRRRADRADGEDGWARGSSARFPPRRRPRIAREHGVDEVILYTRAGFRSRGEAADRRPRRGRGLRFGGQDHLREEPELPAPARAAGAVRAVERPGSAVRSAPF